LSTLRVGSAERTTATNGDAEPKDERAPGVEPLEHERSTSSAYLRAAPKASVSSRFRTI